MQTADMQKVQMMLGETPSTDEQPTEGMVVEGGDLIAKGDTNTLV